MSLLDAKNITVDFDGFRAVEDFSLTVGAGECVGLIGPNGAGKSTAFSALTGFEGTGGGSVAFDGRDITELTPPKRARLGLGRTFQVPREFSHLTVRENLMAAAPSQAGENVLNLIFRPGGIRAQETGLAEKADGIIDFLNLGAVREQYATGLSGGQKKLLELGRVLMTGPKLILLDEPFAGVNPVLIGEISERIRELRADGIGFLIVEHNLNALSAIVSRMYAMDRGRIIGEGAPDDLLASPHVREAYMGGVA
jgi:branched-chain amino acid transport system ATP-binding protein